MFAPRMTAFQEFMTQETLPLSTIQNAVLEFLQGRDDVVLFGAQAVNAYVPEPRMTQDVDLVVLNAVAFADELRAYLSERFHIALRVREIGAGRGYRLYQVQKTGNRHLVDIRPAEQLPQAQRIADVLVMAPAELVAAKVLAYANRQGSPKSGTDWRDLAMLLLAFPELKSTPATVAARLAAMGAGDDVQAAWQRLAAQEIRAADETDEF